MTDLICLGITAVLLLGIGCFYHTVVRVSPEEGWASGLMTVMSAIFLSGLFHDTRVGLFAVYLVGVTGLVIGLVQGIRGKAYSIRSFLVPSIVMVLGVTGLSAIAFHGFHVCNWDELFQWGKAANYMVLHDRLPNGADYSGQNLLMSTATVFHYFVARIGAWVTGSPVESDYYVSNLLLWFSAVILPLSGTGWSGWKKVFGFGIFQLFFSVLAFVQPCYNIYTDQATAAWAGALIAWLLLKKCTKRNSYLVPLILINVGMMKSMVGPLFAGIVLLSIVCLYLTDRKYEKKAFLPPDWGKQLLSGKGLFAVFTVISSVFYTVIWSFIIRRNAVYRTNEEEPAEHADQLVKTVKSMLAKVFETVNGEDDSIYLSYAGFFLITLILLTVVYPVFLEEKWYVRFRNLLAVYLGGFFGYFLVMLYAYLHVFGYVDSVRAMSLDRYYSDYILLGILPVSVPLFVQLQKTQSKEKGLLKRFITMGLTLCMLYGVSGYLLPKSAHIYAVDTAKYKERERFLSYAKQVRKKTGEEGKIYFINQSRSGLFTLVADYELGKQVTREGMCFKFREDTSEAILGLTEYGIETLPEVLDREDYEYLWVYSLDDYLVEQMDALFGTGNLKEGSFYRVLKSGKRVTLEPMGRIK